VFIFLYKAALQGSPRIVNSNMKYRSEGIKASIYSRSVSFRMWISY